MTKLDGVEGLWYEQPDILSKYKRRDERLERICYTQYGKMIRTGGNLLKNESVDEDIYDDNYEYRERGRARERQRERDRDRQRERDRER